jgi:GH15 family glucan-1,4-alpha-glucosidase
VISVTTGDLLADRSVTVLKAGQAASGAFIASPSFPTYHYAWLRDGAFCAYALDRVGETTASAAFHQWVARSIETHRQLIESAIARTEGGEAPPPEEMPPARYTLEGTLEQPDDDPWPNFQFDGYGMWLWALAEHLAAPPPAELRGAVELAARYLRAAWRLKSFSCWEEFDEGEHASTLGAAVAGLDAAARLLGESEWADEAGRVRETLVARFLHDGRFGRGPDDPRVDGSLLWLAVPFGVFGIDDPRLQATIAQVVSDLHCPGGGVYRYLGDTYYGGGEWILLACSLAWHRVRTGDIGAARGLRDWVRAQARPNGDLPEQVSDHAQSPEMIGPWINRWGPIATPLLWSHAMYLILEAETAWS